MTKSFTSLTWKSLAAGAVAFTIAGTPLAFAQGPSGAATTQAQQTKTEKQTRFSAEDATAFADARIAAIKTGLKLTPEQEKNWPAVESAIRAIGKDRFDRMSARKANAEAGDHNAMDRLRLRADAMTQRASDLKKFADAATPLYKSLDEAQQRRLMVLSRDVIRPEGGRHNMRHKGHRH